jgi:hypothetical protein
MNHKSLIVLQLKEQILYLHILDHKHEDTVQYKNKWSTISKLPQKTHLGSPCHFLLSRLYLVKILLCCINHRKICILKGIEKFHV